MRQPKNLSGKYFDKYEMVPPEGGWGYIIVLAVAIMFIVTIVPVSVFGLIFGPYLATLGDETSSTALIGSVFSTVTFFTGLPANHLLQNYSYRKIGLLGAVIFFFGSFSSIIATSVTELIITFSIIQGFGFGLLFPSGFSAFNEYFLLRRNVMMSICQSIVGAVSIIWPILTAKLIEHYGFRGTVAIYSALSLNGILAMLTLQPSKWHCEKKKIIINETQIQDLNFHNRNQHDPKTATEEYDGLMKENYIQEDIKTTSKLDLNELSLPHEEKSKWRSIVEALDLDIFKDPLYVNISVGVAMAMTSDVAFLTLIPVLLNSYGFQKSEITFIFTVFFAADLIGRIFLSIISAIFQIWNRYLLLAGVVLTIVFRIAYTIEFSFWWITICTACLGLLRCCIQIPYPLVFAEQYGPRFTTAFSLNMVVCGCTTLVVGPLASFVKNLTQSNVMVVHLLTVVYALCAIPWSIEIFVTKLMKRKEVCN